MMEKKMFFTQFPVESTKMASTTEQFMVHMNIFLGNCVGITNMNSRKVKHCSHGRFCSTVKNV